MKKSIINVSLFVLYLVLGLGGSSLLGQGAIQGKIFVDSKCGDCLVSKDEIQGYLDEFKSSCNKVINVIYSSQDCSIPHAENKTKYYGPEIGGKNLWYDNTVNNLIIVQPGNHLVTGVNALDISSSMSDMYNSIPEFDTPSCMIFDGLAKINDIYNCNVNIQIPENCYNSSFNPEKINIALNGTSFSVGIESIGPELVNNFGMNFGIYSGYSIAAQGINTYSNGSLTYEYIQEYGDLLSGNGIAIINIAHPSGTLYLRGSGDSKYGNGIHIYKENTNGYFKNFYDLGIFNKSSVNKILNNNINAIEAFQDALVKIYGILRVNLDDKPDLNTCDEFGDIAPSSNSNYIIDLKGIPNRNTFESNYSMTPTNLDNAGSNDVSLINGHKARTKETGNFSFSDFAGISQNDINKLTSAFDRLNSPSYNVKIHFVISSSDNESTEPELNAHQSAIDQFNAKVNSQEYDAVFHFHVSKSNNTYDLNFNFNSTNFDPNINNGVNQNIRDEQLERTLKSQRDELKSVNADGYDYGLKDNLNTFDILGVFSSITKSIFTDGNMPKVSWTNSPYTGYPYDPNFMVDLPPPFAGILNPTIEEAFQSYLLVKVGYSCFESSEVRAQVLEGLTIKNMVKGFFPFDFNPNDPPYLQDYKLVYGTTSSMYNVLLPQGTIPDLLSAGIAKSGLAKGLTSLGASVGILKNASKLKSALKNWTQEYVEKFLRHVRLIKNLELQKRFSEIVKEYPGIANKIKKEFEIEDILNSEGKVISSKFTKNGVEIDVSKAIAALPDPKKFKGFYEGDAGFLAKLGDETFEFNKFLKDIDDAFPVVEGKIPLKKMKEWGDEFARHADNLDTWKQVKEWGKGGRFAIDAHTLTQISKHLKDGDFLNNIGGVNKYKKIIKEYAGTCRICEVGNSNLIKELPSPDKMLKDLTDYVKTHTGKPGFDQVIQDLGGTAYKQMGAQYISRLTKKMDWITEFEVKYIEKGNFRADWSVNGRLFEAKSWSVTGTIKNISSSEPTAQLLSYLKNGGKDFSMNFDYNRFVKSSSDKFNILGKEKAAVHIRKKYQAQFKKHSETIWTQGQEYFKAHEIYSKSMFKNLLESGNLYKHEAMQQLIKVN